MDSGFPSSPPSSPLPITTYAWPRKVSTSTRSPVCSIERARISSEESTPSAARLTGFAIHVVQVTTRAASILEFCWQGHGLAAPQRGFGCAPDDVDLPASAAGASLKRNLAGEALIDEPVQPAPFAPCRRLAACQGEVKTSIVACLRCWYAASTLNAPHVLCLCR